MIIYIPPDCPSPKQAEQIAASFGFTITTEPPQTLALEYTDKGLLLRDPEHPQEVMLADFLTGRTGYRLSTTANTSQPLIKAIGKKKDTELNVLDATAGLGADSMLMAVCGCTVTMCERVEIMAALLTDALDRAMQDEFMAEIINERITLHHCPAQQIITTQTFDVIYLDPMFPERKKSAKVKKEMRLASLAVGADEDCTQLLQTARENCAKVVVKRPVKAPPIAPNFSRQSKGRSIRFDIYIQ